jgi:hypothetical protein
MERYVVEWHKEGESKVKSTDWYWVLGIAACAGIVIAFLFENLLLATIIGLGSIILMLLTRMEEGDMVCAINHREITVNDTTYPLHDIDAYHIDEKDGEPVLRFRTGELLMPVVAVHIPEDYITEIDYLMGSVVPQKRIEESLSHRVLEIFGI